MVANDSDIMFRVWWGILAILELNLGNSNDDVRQYVR